MLDSDDEEQDAERGEAFDPLADLLFGLVAIMIPIFAILLPTMRTAADAVPAPNIEAASALVRADLRIDGRPAQPFVAGAQGLKITGEAARLVDVERILDDRPLALALQRLRDQQHPVLLLIEPDGHESAFLFETVAAVHGPARIHQVRIDQACTFVRDPFLAGQCVSTMVSPQEPRP
jgi:hypothetical protein